MFWEPEVDCVWMPGCSTILGTVKSEDSTDRYLDRNS